MSPFPVYDELWWDPSYVGHVQVTSAAVSKVPSIHAHAGIPL